MAGRCALMRGQRVKFFKLLCKSESTGVIAKMQIFTAHPPKLLAPNREAYALLWHPDASDAGSPLNIDDEFCQQRHPDLEKHQDRQT